MGDRPDEIPPHLAQYLAQSIVSTLHPDVYEALTAFEPEELEKLTRLGEALRQYHDCEPDPCLRQLYLIH